MKSASSRLGWTAAPRFISTSAWRNEPSTAAEMLPDRRVVREQNRFGGSEPTPNLQAEATAAGPFGGDRRARRRSVH